MRLKNFLLVVEDIERAKKFYKELFSLDVLRDFDNNVILTQGLVLQERKSWEQAFSAAKASLCSAFPDRVWLSSKSTVLPSNMISVPASN